MTAVETTLLDETDTGRRLVQHLSVFAGVVILLFARVWLKGDRDLTTGLSIVGVGLALFVVAAVVKQRWDVTYQGEVIRFENNPFTGERLFVDGRRVAKGTLGKNSEMRAPLSRGGSVVARSEAGLARFRCRITVES
jgi:hypothetical protein